MSRLGQEVQHHRVEPMSRDEQRVMYMKMKKKDIVEMLIESNKLLDVFRETWKMKY